MEPPDQVLLWPRTGRRVRPLGRQNCSCDLPSINRNFYSMPRILRRVCSNVLQRRAPLISCVGNLSYRSNIRVDCKAYANFKCQRGNRYD